MMNLISLTSPKPFNNNTITFLPKNKHHSHQHQHTNNYPPKKPQQQPILSGLINGALSLSLSLSLTLLLPCPPLSIALDFPPPAQSSPSVAEYCEDDDIVESKEQELGASNESIVEEAWQIVNDAFLDTGRARWSPQSWLDKKKDILSGSIKSRSKAHNVVRKMLGSLGDPYTRFLSPEEFSKMARYDMTGIGINIKEMRDNNGSSKLKVLGLILDGPAHSAGIRQGDEILSVDGEDVKGNSAFEVSSKLQGPSETFVTVEVKHGNCGPVQSFKIQRQVIARPPVFYRLEQIDNGATSVGYVRLKEFNALARKDIVTAMKRLQDLGASCFVLDLRDNFGGLVEAGIEIAKLFLDKGDTVIYTAGRSQSQNAIVTESTPLVTVPVMVLVNHNTASASEIVASALHDNCKAVLVGEKTFGKGLIQSVYELHDGSGVVVTIGKYVTPGHLDINGNGIEPDFSNIPRWSEVTQYLSSCNHLRQG